MLQIDLPMPNACDNCPLNYDFCWCKGIDSEEEWKKHRDDWNENVCDRECRPEYCPLKEVVRCKDCKHGSIDSVSYPNFWCSAHTEYHKGEYFCADGERKDS